MQLTCLLQILIIYYGPMGSFMGTARAYIWRSAHYLKFTTPTLINRLYAGIISRGYTV
jgi:hypothetical protein